MSFEKLLAAHQESGASRQATTEFLFDCLMNAPYQQQPRTRIDSPHLVPYLLQHLFECYRERHGPDAQCMQQCTIIMTRLAQLVFAHSVNLAILLENVKLDLLGVLIAWIDAWRANQQFLAACLSLTEALALHTCSAAHLRRIWRVLARKSGEASECAAPLVKMLLGTLERLSGRKSGPLAYFELDGETSGVRVIGLSKFPSEFSFCAWLCVESERPIARRPRVFSFLNAVDGGIEALLLDSGRLLVRVRYGAHGKKVEEVECRHCFAAGVWHHVALTHQYHLLGKSSLTLYIDGVRDCTLALRYPSDINKAPLTRMCVATGDRADRCALSAKLGDFALFGEVLQPLDVRKQHACGPNRLFALHSCVHVPGVVESDAAHDIKARRPVFAYSPRLCRGSVCSLALPADFMQVAERVAADGSVTLRAAHFAPPASGAATRLAGTRLMRTLDVRDTLHCVGGVATLLPLLRTQHCAAALRLLVALLSTNERNQNDFVRCSGPALIALLLRELPAEHFCDDMLNGVRGLLLVAQSNVLKRRLLEDLLLDFDAWIAAPAAMQLGIAELLQLRAAKSLAYVRRAFPVRLWLDVLERFYSTTHQSVARRSLEPADVRAMRAKLLEIVYWLMGGERNRAKSVRQAEAAGPPTPHKGKLTSSPAAVLVSGAEQLAAAPPSAEALLAAVEAIFQHLQHNGGDADVLWLLVRSLAESEPLCVVVESLRSAPHCFVALLAADSAEMRIAALRAVGVYMTLVRDSVRKAFAAKFGITFLVDKLGAHAVTEREYIGLLKLLIGDLSANCKRPALGGDTTLLHADALIPVLQLLSMSDDLQLIHTALDDLIALTACAGNCDAVLALSCWQLWILELPMRVRSLAKTADQVDALFDSTTTLLSNVLTHAVCSLHDGWRHVELSIEFARYLLGAHSALRASAVVRRLLLKLVRRLATRVRQVPAASDSAGGLLARNIGFVACVVEQHVRGTGSLTMGTAVDHAPVIDSGGSGGGGDDDDDDDGAKAEKVDDKPAAAVAQVRWLDFELTCELLDLFDWVLAAPVYSDALDREVMLTMNGAQAVAAVSTSSPLLGRRRRRARSSSATSIDGVLLAGGATGSATMSLFHTQLALVLCVVEHADTEHDVAAVMEQQTRLRALHSLARIEKDAGKLSDSLATKMTASVRDRLSEAVEPLKAMARLFDKCTQRLRMLLRKPMFTQKTAANSALCVKTVLVVGNAIAQARERGNAAGNELMPVFRDLLAHPMLAFIEADLILAGLTPAAPRAGQQQAARAKQQSAINTNPFAEQSPATPIDATTAAAIESGVLSADESQLAQLAVKLQGMLSSTMAEAEAREKRNVQLVAPFRSERRNQVRGVVAGQVDNWQMTATKQNAALNRSVAQVSADIERNADLARRVLAAHRCVADDAVRDWWRKRVMRQLTHERATWYSADEQTPLRWTVDATESSLRMRLRLRRNYHFDSHTEATHTFRSQKYDIEQAQKALIKDSWQFESSECDDDDDDEEDDDDENEEDQEGEKKIDAVDENDDNDEKKQANGDDDDDDDDDWQVLSGELPKVVDAKAEGPALLDDNREILRLVARESGSIVLRVEHVQLLGFSGRADDGSIEIGTTAIYFYGADTQDKEENSSSTHQWPLHSIKSVYRRRFLLKETAIELFFSDNRSQLLNFSDSGTRRRVIKVLASHARGECRIDVKERSPAKQLRVSGHTERWQRGEISNFEYLMHLNSIAGRTYSDLNQYPVFPWVLSDYTSAELDLSDARVYRDLRKPMGALNESRLAALRERYACAPTAAERFLYGTHYSSAAGVLYYLLRVEPYTTQHVALQSGKFDHADRLFHSVAAAWNSCTSSSSDVKELVPEFFYLPEFLRNENQFELGVMQTGERLGDVKLPPWAHGSADRFVRTMRAALESPHVSRHLHHWIDLIFGYKQRGEAAIAADNVFHPLTYGDVDYDAIEDPIMRLAAVQQIANFGQCPRQLLRKPHPARHASASVAPLLSRPRALVADAALALPHVAASLHCVEQRIYSCGAQVGDVTAFQQGDSRMLLHLELAGVVPHMAAPLDTKRLITVDPVHHALRLVSLDSGKTLQVVTHHTAAITALACDASGSLIVSGSRDATACVWELVAPKTHTGLTGLLLNRTAHKQLASAPRATLIGHDAPISAVALCSELDVCVTCSLDGSINFYSLSTGEYIRSRDTADVVFRHAVIAPQTGDVVVASDECMHTYTINARQLATSKTPEVPRAVLVDQLGHNVISGGARGIVIRDVISLEQRFNMQLDAPIVAMCWLHKQTYLLISLDNKKIFFFRQPAKSTQSSQ